MVSVCNATHGLLLNCLSLHIQVLKLMLRDIPAVSLVQNHTLHTTVVLTIMDLMIE